MRKLIVLAAGAASLAGCASAAPPPGGPEDHAPPQVISISPDSGAVNVTAEQVEFRFDEVLAQPSGSADMDKLVLISPRDGAPRISWHRGSIGVKPREDFRANTAYTVTLLAGLRDLRGNISKQTHTIVFSTGPDIPRLGILGRVFNWAGQSVAPNAFVQALSHPDSVTYVTKADSLGGFVIGPMPAGNYTVTGFIDQNTNRALDRTEQWDSTHVMLTDSRPIVELYAYARDTFPPAMASARAVDSLTIEVAFDRGLAPDQPLTPAQFIVQRADSTPLQVTEVVTQTQLDSARADSLAASRDSALAADTTRRAGTGRAVAPTAPKPHRPAPPMKVYVHVSPTSPLVPGDAYRITAVGVLSVMHRAGTSSRSFTRQAPPSP